MAIYSKAFKVGLDRGERDNIKKYVLSQTNIKPTPIESVAILKDTYKPEDYKPDNQAYKDIYLIESGEDAGWLYWFNTNTMLWEKSIKYENDSPEVEELKAKKQDKDMIDWGTMPETITDKKTFYREVSKVFATPTQSIYMFGTPEELQRVWDIWDKPTGLKATHVYIAIKSLSNQSNRHAFIMWVFASNYGNPYFRIISGYNGSYTGTDDKGWVNVNKLATINEELLKGNKKVLATDYQGGLTSLEYDVLPTPNTMVLRQTDGTIQSAMPKEDTDVATKKYVDSKLVSGGNATDLYLMLENPNPDELTIDLNQDSTAVEMHLDRNFVSSLDQETTLAVMRPSSNKQQWTLGGEEVARLKGLRVWIKFAYNGNTLVLSHDIRFPTDRASYQWYVSTPIPNPAIFSEKIIVQYDTSNDILSLNTTGGSISADTQIIEVKGIK